MNIIKTIFKTLLLLLTVGYLVFALVKVSRPTQEMVCTGVEYQFADSGQICFIDSQMVNAMLAKHNIVPKGRKLADIDLRNIDSILSANPYIDTVRCYHTASGKLCIRIKSMHPMFHVFNDAGEEYYVDSQGRRIPAGGLSADLLVVTGHVTPEFVCHQLMRLGRILNEDEFWNEQIQQVYVEENGNVELIPSYSDQRILIGEPKHIEEKLERVRLFYENAMPKTGWNRYNVIDARYNKQIICSNEKK